MRLFACLIVAPQRRYDEPATLSYAISSFCPTSADGLQFAVRAAELAGARPELAGAVEPLLKAREAVGRQIADLDRKVMR